MEKDKSHRPMWLIREVNSDASLLFVFYWIVGKWLKDCKYKKSAEGFGENMSKRKKWTYEEVKDYFEEQGCELLSDEYVDNYTNLKFKCSCGRIDEKCLKVFQKTHKCRYCNIEKRSKNRSHDIEFIRKYFKDNGCELLSTEYKGVHEPLNYICSCGNPSKISFSSFQNGSRCKKCSGYDVITYDYLYDYFKQQNCELLTTREEYINTDTKLKYICTCGNEGNTDWEKFKNGRRCNECGKKIRIEKKKIPFNVVKKTFEDNNCKLISTEYIHSYELLEFECSCGNIDKKSLHNFKKFPYCLKCHQHHKYTYNEVYDIFKDADCLLLSTEYIDNSTPLDYICNCGNTSKIVLNSFLSGTRCKLCGIEKFAKQIRHSYEYVYNYFKEQGCELLSKEYKNSRDNLDFICSCGNKHSISFAAFKYLDQRCPKCGLIKQMQSLYDNGTAPRSTQQIYIHNIVGGELNYPIGNCCVDILLDDNIICECDFSGHWLSVKLGVCTQKEFDFKEIKRNYFLYSKGYKIIRIISRNDLIPDDEIVLSMIKYANEYLENRHWISFDIDNKLVKCSQFEQFYDFGELTKVSKNNIM